MPNLKTIRKRIQAVKGTQQLTRAMKLVAAAKLRRAQEAALAQRPYEESLVEVIHHLAQRVEEGAHPLVATRPVRKVLLLLYSSDRGLCGSFNLNVCRAFENYHKENAGKLDEIGLAVIGKKGFEFLSRRSYKVSHNYRDMFADTTFDRVSRIGNELAQEFVDGGYDALYVVYNWFKSAVVQKVRFERILPMELPETQTNGPHSHVEHLFEPDRKSLLDTLFPMYVNMCIYQALLESVASEMGARMTAMDNATNNAGDLIRRLTLIYNKARQDTITKELMDIVGGANAVS
jgi:F-type H+-transporting ATPase subunit gamma